MQIPIPKAPEANPIFSVQETWRSLVVCVNRVRSILFDEYPHCFLRFLFRARKTYRIIKWLPKDMQGHSGWKTRAARTLQTRMRKQCRKGGRCSLTPNQTSDAPMDSALPISSALFLAESLSFSEPQCVINSVDDALITVATMFNQSSVCW